MNDAVRAALSFHDADSMTVRHEPSTGTCAPGINFLDSETPHSGLRRCFSPNGLLREILEHFGTRCYASRLRGEREEKKGKGNVRRAVG